PILRRPLGVLLTRRGGSRLDRGPRNAGSATEAVTPGYERRAVAAVRAAQREEAHAAGNPCEREGKPPVSPPHADGHAQGRHRNEMEPEGLDLVARFEPFLDLGEPAIPLRDRHLRLGGEEPAPLLRC